MRLALVRMVTLERLDKLWIDSSSFDGITIPRGYGSGVKYCIIFVCEGQKRGIFFILLPLLPGIQISESSLLRYFTLCDNIIAGLGKTVGVIELPMWLNS